MLSAVVPLTKMSGRLESLSKWAKQATDLGIEIIFVHDKQDENTGTELNNLIREIDSDLIKLIEVNVASPGLARNIGLEASEGEWITFWDSDDEPDPSGYLELIKQMKLNNKQIGLGNFEILRENKKEVSLSRHHGQLLKTVNHPGLWRYVFARERIRGKVFSKARMGEDQIFLASLEFVEDELQFSEACIYRYIIGSSQQLTADAKARAELIETIDNLTKLVDKQNQGNSFALALLIRVTITSLKLGNNRRICSQVLHIFCWLFSTSSRGTALSVIRGVLR